MKIRDYAGSGAFYKTTASLAVPIMIQLGVVNLVNLINTVMVGQLGTDLMSGVAIANQILNVSTVCINGALLGIGIFTAQFYGKRDNEGLAHTFRFKLIVSLLLTLLSILVFFVFGKQFIGSFIHSAGAEAATTASSAWSYMLIMMAGLVPYSLSQAYASTLREANQTLPPMVGSSVAVLTNFILNYALIFGNLGCPALGAPGAAVATVMSRFIEFGIIAVWAHANGKKNLFLKDAYRFKPIPAPLLKDMAARSMPLLINETLYAASNAMIVQCFSLRGLSAVAAISIASAVTQLFMVALLSVGPSLGIIVGNDLGAIRFDEARSANRRLTWLAVVVGCITGAVLVPVSLWFPGVFNTSAEVRDTAGQLIRVAALMMPVRGFTHAAYYSLRSGGKTLHTLFFDGGYVTLIELPLIYILAHYTALPIVTLYAAGLAAELSKCGIGYHWVKKGIWICNVVPDIPSVREAPPAPFQA